MRAALVSVLVLLGLAAAPVAGSAADAAVPRGFVGVVSEDVFAGGAAYTDAQLKRMATARVGVLRQVFDWSRIEPVRGRVRLVGDGPLRGRHRPSPDRGDADPLQRAGLASPRPAGSRLSATYPPKRPRQFAAFAWAVVARYGPDGSFWRERPDLTARPIRSWQVWNEPNLTAYWRPRPQARAYARMLATTARAIRARDAGAEVISAGLPESRVGVPLKRYLTALLRAGAARSMGTLAINPYSPSAGGVVRLLRRAVACSITMAAGAPRCAPRRSAGPAAARPARIARRRAGRPAASAGSSAGWPRTAARSTCAGSSTTTGAMRGPTPPATFWGLHTGLLTRAGDPKPALASFAAAAKRIGAPAAV